MATEQPSDTPVYTGLVRRAIDSGRPAFDRNAPTGERLAAGAKTFGGLTAITAGIVAVTDGIAELGAHDAVAGNLLSYVGPAPLITGAVALGLGIVPSAVMATAAAAGKLSEHDQTVMHTVLSRTRVGAYATGGALLLLGGAADLVGTTGLPGMNPTGHALIDTGAAIAAAGIVSHGFARMWRTGLPTAPAQQALGE